MLIVPENLTVWLTDTAPLPADGAVVGAAVVGAAVVGAAVGAAVGAGVGAAVGAAVGAGVGLLPPVEAPAPAVPALPDVALALPPVEVPLPPEPPEVELPALADVAVAAEVGEPPAAPPVLPPVALAFIRRGLPNADRCLLFAKAAPTSASISRAKRRAMACSSVEANARCNGLQ